MAAGSAMPPRPGAPNTIRSTTLPRAFDGFTILHLSDLHADMSIAAMDRLIELLPSLHYDICVLTGDYRGKTFGPFDAAIDGVARVSGHLAGPVYGVLGNHDTVRMVPELEDLGIRMLLNEAETIVRDSARIHLAGIDDAHFFRVDNLEKAAAGIPLDDFRCCSHIHPRSIAKRPQWLRRTAGRPYPWRPDLPAWWCTDHAGFRPAAAFGAGAWRYGGMAGYTSAGVGCSIVTVRLNCRRRSRCTGWSAAAQ